MVSHNTTYKKWNARRVLYKGKRIYIKEPIRKGICQSCGKTGQTNIHHTSYDDSNPLANTIELCVPCHSRTSIQLGQICKWIKK